MSTACLEQIRYWCKAVKDMQKGIDRKNKHINRLQRENSLLVKEVAELKLYQAENELKESSVNFTWTPFNWFYESWHHHND